MHCIEAVIIGSGPSLTPEDCQLVRAWRAATDDRLVIAINTSFRMAPWADVLFAMDKKWWVAHNPEAIAFTGEKVCISDVYREIKTVRLPNCGNSGGGAMLYAHQLGARKIVLLGFDGMGHSGKVHWHGDHPAPLGNAGSWRSWPRQMDSIMRRLTKVRVVNSSRWTVYKNVPRVTLEEALGIKEPEVA